MSISFDDILKKGKQAGGTSIADPKDHWSACINNIMYDLHLLNSLYGDTSIHHIDMEQQSCEKCGEVTFILSVRDWDDRKKVLKFHKSNWKYLDSDTYQCEKCK